MRWIGCTQEERLCLCHLPWNRWQEAAGDTQFWTIVLMGSEASAGQFRKAVYYRAGMRPSEVITADFNNDGNADLAFADWLSNEVVILLGNSDGTFQKPLIIRAPSPTDLV
jgi:hypothetical protein